MSGLKSDFRVSLAQVHCHVGDLEGNAAMIVDVARKSKDTDLLLFPELTICGYPPEDLLAYDDFVSDCERKAERVVGELARAAEDRLHVAMGLPRKIDGKLYNVLQVVNRGEVVAMHRKLHLPNYGVFDEKRHFEPGDDIAVFEINDATVALAICHDIWVDGFWQGHPALQADLLAVANASPFFLGCQEKREEITCSLSKSGCDVAYVNLVGAQDEHVFDGGSHYASGGKLMDRFPSFAETARTVEVQAGVQPLLPEIEQIEQALILGIRDYVAKAGGGPAYIGLSGGIDSAVALCLAQKALAAKNVVAVMLPSSLTSSISVEDAALLAGNLGVECKQISIMPAYEALLNLLETALATRLADVARENLQARIRGVLLMALANHSQGLVLTTGNKSEMATGYATLYGDMAGAFAVLKDVSKMRVYELARHANKDGEVIPDRIITRPPTAELRENQLDSDSLPDYSVIDELLSRIVEKLESPNEVAQTVGFDDTLLFTELLERSEFKRRQAPIGPTLTRRAFGKDWRMPVSNRHSFAKQIRDADGDETG